MVVATVMLLINIDTKGVIINRNEPSTRRRLDFMYEVEQSEATVLIFHLRKKHRFNNNPRKSQSRKEWNLQLLESSLNVTFESGLLDFEDSIWLSKHYESY